MRRVFLFILTNIAVLVVLSIALRLLGVESILDEQGVNLNMGALLTFAAVFGMGGSFISLALSKWMAKRMMGARVRRRESGCPRSRSSTRRPRTPSPPGRVATARWWR
jgi:heat shock protein HtpX